MIADIIGRAIVVWVAGIIICLLYTQVRDGKYEYRMAESIVIALFLWPLLVYDVVEESLTQYRKKKD